jgi:hypothetical protein
MAGLPGRRSYTTIHLGDTPFGRIWPVMLKDPGQDHISSERFGPLLAHGKLYCVTGSSQTRNSVPSATSTPLITFCHDCLFCISSNARRHLCSGRSCECVARCRGLKGGGKGAVRLPVKISSHLDGGEQSGAALAHPAAGFRLRTERHRASIARKLPHTLSSISCDIAHRR